MNDELKPSDDIVALKEDIMALNIELMEVQNNLHNLWFALVLIVIVGFAFLLTWVVSVVMS